MNQKMEESGKDIKKLIQIRAGHRSVVTKTVEKIYNIVSDFDGRIVVYVGVYCKVSTN